MRKQKSAEDFGALKVLEEWLASLFVNSKTPINLAVIFDCMLFTFGTLAENILVFREHFIQVQIRIESMVLELDVVAHADFKVLPGIWKPFFIFIKYHT